MSIFTRTTALLAISASLFLNGCSLPKGEFPSLSKRPYETAEPVSEPVIVEEPPMTALPDELDAQLRALLARHEKADSAWRTMLPTARQAAQAGRGGATGSESWVNAQMILSRLDAARADSIAALGEIDGMIMAQTEKGGNRGLIALLVKAQTEVAAGVATQSSEIAALSRLIG